MPHLHPEHVAAVAPLLAAGEVVWAVYPSRGRSLIATPRRLFVVGPHATEEIPVADIRRVHRGGDNVIVIERRTAPSMAVRVDPADEHGLQALTVLALLAAVHGRVPEDLLPEPAWQPPDRRAETV
jgi:hypothetical protein